MKPEAIVKNVYPRPTTKQQALPVHSYYIKIDLLIPPLTPSDSLLNSLQSTVKLETFFNDIGTFYALISALENILPKTLRLHTGRHSLCEILWFRVTLLINYSHIVTELALTDYFQIITFPKIETNTTNFRNEVSKPTLQLCLTSQQGLHKSDMYISYKISNFSISTPKVYTI